MARLVIHIGLEKTGSTYLQELLRTNADLLEGQGVSYPDFCAQAEHLEVYMAAVQEISWMHRRFGITTIEQLAGLTARVEDGLARMAERHDVAVVTSERLSVIRRQDAIDHLAALTRRYFDEVDVVAFLRRPDHAVGSYYGQAVKAGMTGRDAQAFLARQGRPLNVVAVVDRWRSAFGTEAVHGWPYLERYRQGGDITVGLLLEHLGLAAPTADDPGPWQRPERPVNVRLSAEATEYVRMLNPRVPRWRTDGAWNGPQRAMLVRDVSARFPGRDAAAPPDVVAATRAAYPPATIAEACRRPGEQDAAWEEWLAQPPGEGVEPPVIPDAAVAALAAELFVPAGRITPDGATPVAAARPAPTLRSVPRRLKRRAQRLLSRGHEGAPRSDVDRGA